MKHNYIVGLAGILFIVALQSCGLTKKYERPETYKSESYRANEKLTDTNSVGKYEWKQLFSDSLLKSYIDEALKNNFDVLKAQQRLQIANSYLRQAKAGYLPNINAGLSAGKTGVSEKSFNGQVLPANTSFNDIQLGASLSWELDVWGKINSQRKAALAQYLETENAQRYIKSQIVAGIANSYYSLLALDAQKEILLSNIENRKEGVVTINALKAGGLVTEVAVKQNEALLYTAQAILIDVENQTKIQENAFSILLGRMPDSVVRAKLDTLLIPKEIKVGVPIQLLENRPDVLAAEYNLMNAFQLTKVAHASLYPTLSINAAAGLNAQNFNQLFSANALFSNLVGNLTQPIFNQRKLRTQKQVRLAEQEIALLDYKQTILYSYAEVSDALYTYNASKAKLIVKRQEDLALTRAVEFSEELQKQGLANYLEVLRAKDNTLSVQLDIVNTELQALLSSVNLYRALGGGWR